MTPAPPPARTPRPVAGFASEARESLVAAIDVGGTVIKAGLVDRDAAVRYERRHPAAVDQGPAALVAQIESIAAGLSRAAMSRGRLRALGIGVPGIVDQAAGIARYAANLGWRDVPFGAMLVERLDVPVFLGHDVRNGALAEARLGAGRDAASVYFLAIGTGIAGGQVTRGVVDDGATGQAGEIGHLLVRRGGPRCNCGNRGCLEAMASASRIAEAYRRRSGSAVSAADVARLVEAGDPVAVAVWDRAVTALADALAAQVVLADPGCIVIGGGLSLAGDTLLRPLAGALPERLTFRAPPPVRAALLGDRAGLVGAALRAWDALGGQSER